MKMEAQLFISQNWVTIVFSVIAIALLYYSTDEDEKESIEKFGEEYKDYMRRVPRINIVMGLIRKLYKRRI